MSNYIDSSFDTRFKGINSLHWLPWVGKDYSKAPQGKRFLIVGESHYEKWTPFFGPRNTEIKLGFQALLGLCFVAA